MISAQNMFLMYFLLKPYYILASGSIQIGDIFLLGALISHILFEKKIMFSKLDKRKTLLIFLFVFEIFLINSTYQLKYNDIGFSIATLYYVFNLIGIVLFTSYYKKKNFLVSLLNISYFNIIIQFLIYFSGKGRWYFNIRYMGTLNDPNQLAFYIMITTFFIHSIAKLFNREGWKTFLIYFMSFFLIAKSASTGVTVPYVLFLTVVIFLKLKEVIDFKKLKIKIIITSFLGTMAICVFVLFSQIRTNSHQITGSEKLLIVSRIEEKFNKVLKTDSTKEKTSIFKSSIIKDRGLDKIPNAPYYLLWGGGEGMSERFEGEFKGEIHSTLPSIAFYYGIIGLGLICSWIWLNIKNVLISQKIICLILLFESFFLLNQRQLLFWVFFLISSLLKEKSDKKISTIKKANEIEEIGLRGNKVRIEVKP